MFQDGQRLGEFEILERLGQGGMGAVYKARQVSLKRFVALKTLQASLASDPEYIERFHREAIAAAGLNHPNLVQVYSAGETDGLHWFAMEYVEGESAQARVKRKERLDTAEAIAIGIHIATALEYASRKAQLIHRDIKPDNIFLSSDGEVKLGDLGLAKSVGVGEAQSLTMTGAAMGTPHYVSPEQGEGKRDVDLRADIYSLGCTLFHLVSGETPFKGDTALGVMMKHVTAPVPALTSVWPACPAELSCVVMKMMQKQPAARQQTYAEVLTDLRRAYDAITSDTLPQVLAVTRQPQQPQPKPARAVDPSAPTMILPAPDAAPAAAPPNSKSKTQNSKSRAAMLAILVAIVGAVLWFAFGKKEPQLSDAGRAAKVLGAAAAPDPSASPAADGEERRENPVAASPTPATATKDAPFENSLRMKFVAVPITGGPTNGQRVLFSIWDTRVRDYEIFAKETKREWSKPSFAQGPTHPAVNVSWEDAQAFCKWLTDRERRAGMLGARERYRLPSDHEWSCAVGIGDREDAALLPEEKKGRIDGVFAWGDQWPPPDKAANIASEELRPILEAEKIVVDDGLFHGVIANYHDGYAFTSPVESFAPNSLGLYDMGGNVQQWCEDWNDKNQKRRALRGASFATQERPFLLSSNRPFGKSSDHYHWRGFRVVLESLPARTTAAVSQPPVPQVSKASPPAASATPAAATQAAPFVNTLGMKFVPVPITGGATDGQRVLFGVWDVRVQDYEVFARETKREWPKAEFAQEGTHPAVNVSWEDATAFCAWLTDRERAAGKLGAKESYRLPGDHEWSCAVGIGDWEDAAKLPSDKSGKIADAFPWGTQWPPPAGAGNYGGEEKLPVQAAREITSTKEMIAGYHDGFEYTSPVASFAANRFGLCDMGGNVWQWCGDWFDKNQKDRVVRGSTWSMGNRGGVLSSYRYHNAPGLRFNYYGFRCVLGASAR